MDWIFGNKEKKPNGNVQRPPQNTTQNANAQKRAQVKPGQVQGQATRVQQVRAPAGQVRPQQVRAPAGQVRPQQVRAPAGQVQGQVARPQQVRAPAGQVQGQAARAQSTPQGGSKKATKKVARRA